jgi:hypothetical protein
MQLRTTWGAGDQPTFRQLQRPALTRCSARLNRLPWEGNSPCASLPPWAAALRSPFGCLRLVRTGVVIPVGGEQVRFFHSVKKNVHRVWVDHPSFLSKVGRRAAGKALGWAATLGTCTLYWLAVHVVAAAVAVLGGRLLLLVLVGCGQQRTPFPAANGVL